MNKIYHSVFCLYVKIFFLKFQKNLNIRRIFFQ
jgi:hypothetical protein